MAWFNTKIIVKYKQSQNINYNWVLEKIKEYIENIFSFIEREIISVIEEIVLQMKLLIIF